jgi:hypothetical protein
MNRLPYQIYDPSTDLFIGSGSTKEAATGAILDLLRCGYVKLQLMEALDDDHEVLLETAHNVGDGGREVEWEVHGG